MFWVVVCRELLPTFFLFIAECFSLYEGQSVNFLLAACRLKILKIRSNQVKKNQLDFSCYWEHVNNVLIFKTFYLQLNLLQTTRLVELFWISFDCTGVTNKVVGVDTGSWWKTFYSTLLLLWWFKAVAKFVWYCPTGYKSRIAPFVSLVLNFWCAQPALHIYMRAPCCTTDHVISIKYIPGLWRLHRAWRTYLSDFMAGQRWILPHHYSVEIEFWFNHVKQAHT